MSEDPFPRDRVTAMLRRLPAYLRLSWHLAKDPLLGRARRAAVVAAAGYLASPIDLVPGVVPVIGQMDDLAVALAAIRLALAGLSPDRRREHLDAVGLVDDDLVNDLRTLGATTAWLARSGTRLTVRAIRSSGHAAVAGARAAGQATSRVAGAAKVRTVPLAAQTANAMRAASTRAAALGRAAAAATPAGRRLRRRPPRAVEVDAAGDA
jgi:uncharacterized membrane protein YkvA (DUF1232 family)